MPVDNQRRRLVNFRVSEQEYVRLKALSRECGARSFSEFLRSSVIWLIENGRRDLLDLVGFSPVRPRLHPLSTIQRTKRGGGEGRGESHLDRPIPGKRNET